MYTQATNDIPGINECRKLNLCKNRPTGIMKREYRRNITIIRPRKYMYTGRVPSFCPFVGNNLYCGKMAEAIEIPSGVI